VIGHAWERRLPRARFRPLHASATITLCGAYYVGPEDTITRVQYYEAAERPVPNGNGGTVHCRQCGAALDGPPSKRWCSETCRRAYRREHAPAPPPPLVAHDTATIAPARDDNILVEQLVTTIAQVAAAQLTAVTFELGGVSVTVGRVDDLGRGTRKA
jgi:hypothetical protein